MPNKGFFPSDIKPIDLPVDIPYPFSPYKFRPRPSSQTSCLSLTMSRHQAYRNYDYENDIDEYDGDEDYGEEEAELSPEDKAQMEAATIEVRGALGPQASKVTTTQIQDALWHYYYDVDKTATYLVDHYIAPPAPKAAKAAPAQKAKPSCKLQARCSSAHPRPCVPSSGEVVARKQTRQRHPAIPMCASPSTTDLLPATRRRIPQALPTDASAVELGSRRRSGHFSFASFFHDMPWGNIPKDRQSTFIAPLLPRGGLLGGAPSKLQQLALARKKKAEEQRLGEKEKQPDVQSTTQGLRDMSIVPAPENDGIEPAPPGSQGSTTTTVPLKRGGGPIVEGRAKRASAQVESQPAEASFETDFSAPEEVEEPPVEMAAPSAFAQTLVGSAQGAPRATPRAYYPLPYMAFTSSVADAFSGPSPDDVVLSAQAKASNKRLATTAKKATGSDAKTDQVADGVKGIKIDDTPLPKSKNLDVVSEYKKSNSKKNVSFVVVGHVDAGKSTLMGRLLLDLKMVDQRTVDKYRKEAEAMGKSSFALAWVLDQRSEERARGVTIDIATNRFETETTCYTILDAPGHRDFIPNMIAGASQADFAVLVVDATTGAFESGLKGQTREHALLIRSMGVTRIIVAVNKLDTTGWSQERFDEISQQVSGFLTATGFLMKNISFVPVSGLLGGNMASKTTDPACDWYKGNTLIEELEKSEPLPRATDKPLRMTISEVFKTAQSSLTVSGRIDAGSLQTGDALLVQPSGEKAYVKSLELDYESADWAVAGQHVVLHLSHIDPVHVRVGDIICDVKSPISCIDTFTIKALAFDVLMPMRIDVHRGRLHAAGQIVEMPAILDKVKGTVIKQKPRVIKPASVARVVVKLGEKAPLEAGQRIVLRSNGETIAAGLLE